MAMQAEHRLDEELSVLRLDYTRLLRRSREAFERGDVREGLRLLQMAAVMELHLAEQGGPNGSAVGEAAV